MSFTYRPGAGLRLRVAKGLAGTAATISVGSVTELAENATPTVVNSGTTAAAVLDFGIPRAPMVDVGWDFDTTTTDSDPGDGKVRFNNATVASVTSIYFDNNDRDGNTVTSWLDSWDDSTSSVKGTLTLTPAADPSEKIIFNVTGSVTDGTGYRKVAVTHVAGTTLPSASAHLGVTFSRTGNDGQDGVDGEMAGPGSSVDGEIALYNGTGGATLKRASTTGVLKASSGVLAAAVAGTDYYNPGGTDVAVADGGTGRSTLTNHGILVGQGTSAIAQMAAGTSGQIVKSGGASADPSWSDNVAAITWVIDGAGSTITTGNKRGLRVPFACTITAWSIGLDQSGSIVIDIWKDTAANYPPTVGDTITASAKPTVSTATHNESSTLTSWTTSIAAGDWLFFNVDSVTSAQLATIVLTVTKS